MHSYLAIGSFDPRNDLFPAIFGFPGPLYGDYTSHPVSSKVSSDPNILHYCQKIRVQKELRMTRGKGVG